MATATQIRQHLSASSILRGPFVMAADQVEDFQALEALGISLDARDVRNMIEAVGLDANVLQPSINPGTIATPAQFLQGRWS